MKNMNPQKSIKSNIVLNCIKTALNVIFPLITFPYISRVLGPVNVGKISFTNSVISYFTLAASLGITTYSLREGAAVRDDAEERNKLFNEIFTVNFISTLISFILLFIVNGMNTALRSYSVLLLIQSVSLIFNWIGVEWIFHIYEDFLQITIRSFFAQLVSLILMFLFVRTTDDYVVYTAITVFAAGGSYAFNFVHARKYYQPHLIRRCELKKHLKTMTVLAANLFAITIYVNSDITMLGFMTGEYEVGLYSTAVKIYTIVKNIMAAIIVGVMPRVSYWFLNDQKENYKALVNKMAQILILLCFPAMIGLFMVSDDIILILAGCDYLPSAAILKILSFALIFAVFGSFFSSYGLIVRRKDKTVLAFTVTSAVINVVFNFILIPLLEIRGAALTTLISEAIVCVAFMFKSEIKLDNRLIKNSIITCVLSSLWIVGLCIFCRGITNIYVRLLITVALSVLGVVVFAILRKEKIVINELKIIMKKFGRRS